MSSGGFEEISRFYNFHIFKHINPRGASVFGELENKPIAHKGIRRGAQGGSAIFDLIILFGIQFTVR